MPYYNIIMGPDWFAMISSPIQCPQSEQLVQQISKSYSIIYIMKVEKDHNRACKQCRKDVVKTKRFSDTGPKLTGKRL